MDALLNTIETLVMLGDPDLSPDNQNEWISLISKCLPCKTLPNHLKCPQDARCLQHVASCFEEFTLHSTLFQVSTTAEARRKHFLKLRAEDNRCICSATMTVRMWTTTNEEVTVLPGEVDKKICAFTAKSTLYNQLISIPNYGAQSSISSTPVQLSVPEAQTSNVQSTCCPIGANVMDPTHIRPASPQVNPLTVHSIPSTDVLPVLNAESASGFNHILGNGVEEANRTNDSHFHLDPRNRSSISLAAQASNEPENIPYHDDGIKPPDAVVFESARHEDSVRKVEQQPPSEVSYCIESPRGRRRFPFLSMRVPIRDSKFFGRAELLIKLEGILMPVSTLPRSHLASLDSGAIIVLHGAPGVGKSSIALELTYRTQAAFDHVFWLRANSNLHLAQSVHEAAVSLGLVKDRRDHNHESSRQKLVAWLSTTSSKWLLVFDDADELQTLPLFTRNRHCGSIIVTSRKPFRKEPDFEDDEGLYAFEVDPFLVEDARDFIRSLAPLAVDAANPAADLATLTKIAEDCRCLPLSLRMVGTILNLRGSSKDQQIMDVLEQHAGRVLAAQPSSPLIYVKLSSAAHALANVITFLDPYCIDDAILLGAQRYNSIPLNAFPMNDHDYFNAKNELGAQALIAARAESRAIDIHRVTSRSLRANLNPDNFRQGFQCASRLLEARWPSRRKMKNIVLGNWPEFDHFHSHVHELSSILVEYDRWQIGKLKQEISNDSYLKVLLLSTW